MQITTTYLAEKAEAISRRVAELDRTDDPNYALHILQELEALGKSITREAEQQKRYAV